jgi:hypothetical protein
MSISEAYVLRRLCLISDPITYPDMVRVMTLIANSITIRCICVGIKPYEGEILPPFAMALAYSPMSCIGCTPQSRL